ncbi:MAG TPA: hypothetical protein VGG28_19310 [Kofleriaceae bacterium]|jgi:hypothetical protein
MSIGRAMDLVAHPRHSRRLVRSVGDSAPSPAPADVAACLAAALAAHPLRVRASVKGIAHVTATFEVPSDP